MTKAELRNAYKLETGRDAPEDWTAKALEAALAEVEERLQKEQEARDEIAKAMASTLNSYKPKYVRAKTARGKRTMHNGDNIANAMNGMDHTEVAALATDILGLEEPLWAGDGTGKYDHLNNGQVRMNSGNRIRQAIKRGDITEDEVLAAIAAA